MEIAQEQGKEFQYTGDCKKNVRISKKKWDCK
jgi:hypothetical protein